MNACPPAEVEWDSTSRKRGFEEIRVDRLLEPDL